MNMAEPRSVAEMAERIAALEDRVEGLEHLLAQVPQAGKPGTAHANGRGLSPQSAEQLRNLEERS